MILVFMYNGLYPGLLPRLDRSWHSQGPYINTNIFTPYTHSPLHAPGDTEIHMQEFYK